MDQPHLLHDSRGLDRLQHQVWKQPEEECSITIIARPTDNGREDESATTSVGSSLYMTLMTMK